jgi:5-methylcytosine-specific restriction endonuclease McrA
MTTANATIDHVVPQWKCKAMGKAANTWTNTVAACRKCQARKGGKDMHEVGMHFHDPSYEPRRPRTRYLVITSHHAPEWRKYIEF